MGRILLIEGDPGERPIVRSRLLELGHEVRVVESGAHGLVEARTEPTDLVLMSTDLGSGVDGTEVCRRLKAAPGLNRIPVVVYSSAGVGAEIGERMFDAGCDAFVPRSQLQHLDRILDVHLRLKYHGDELGDQNRVLELENRRLAEAQRRDSEPEASEGPQDVQAFLSRELAAGRPDGVLLVESSGVVRDCDRGAVELLGSRLHGQGLGRIAPGCGLEAFVRDARTTPREGFRFDVSARRDRRARSLLATVVPVAAGGGGSAQRVLLLIDVDKRGVGRWAASSAEVGLPRQQLGALVEAARSAYVPGAILGVSRAVRELRARVAELAPRRESVLLSGERGTGRALAARVLHYSGGRSGPFLELHCGSLEEAALEAELLGQPPAGPDRPGSPGLVSLARDGTLFLAEIAELPLALQERLDEILERGHRPGGGSRSAARVELHLLASTSRDLGALVDAGEFHPGLAARLQRRTVALPPLRERSEDVAPLAQVFLERHGPAHGVESLSEEASWVMEDYPWPGNVAELEECVERACARAEEPWLEVADLTRPLRDHAASLPSNEFVPAPRVREGSEPARGTHVAHAPEPMRAPWTITEEDPIDLGVYEKKVLLRALDNTGGDKLAAAELLQVGKSTLYRKLKKFGIR